MRCYGASNPVETASASSIENRGDRNVAHLLSLCLRCLGEFPRRSAMPTQSRRDGRLRDRRRLRRAIDRPVPFRTRFSYRCIGSGQGRVRRLWALRRTIVNCYSGDIVERSTWNHDAHLDRRNGFRRRTHHPLACRALRHRLRSERRRRIRCIQCKQLRHFGALLSSKAPDTLGALRTRQPSHLPKAGAPGIVCPLGRVAAHTIAPPKTGPGNRAPRALVTN